jgi:rRNA small subunit pseudouridine methyltransferase Nep1
MASKDAPRIPKTPKEKESTPRLIVVLSSATLESIKLGKGKDERYALLNCDDHVGYLKKYNKDAAEYRPDITHQVHFSTTIQWNCGLS